MVLEKSFPWKVLEFDFDKWTRTLEVVVTMLLLLQLMMMMMKWCGSSVWLTGGVGGAKKRQTSFYFLRSLREVLLTKRMSAGGGAAGGGLTVESAGLAVKAMSANNVTTDVNDLTAFQHKSTDADNTWVSFLSLLHSLNYCKNISSV